MWGSPRFPTPHGGFRGCADDRSGASIILAILSKLSGTGGDLGLKIGALDAAPLFRFYRMAIRYLTRRVHKVLLNSTRLFSSQAQ